MANRLADLLVSLGLESAKYTEGLKKAGQDLTGFAGMAAKAAKNIERLLEFELVLKGAEKLTDFIKSSAEAADQMGKLAQSVGVPVEQLSRLAYAAKMSDVSTEELGANLGRLAKRMAEAAGGSDEAKAAFQAMGVSVTDSNGELRPMQEVLGDVAERFASYKDGAGKAALAQELFGRSGAALIPFLNEGRAGIAALAEEADRLGVTITKSGAASAEEFNDSLTRLGAVIEGVGNRTAAALTPMLTNLGNVLLTSTTQTKALDEAASALAGTVKTLTSAVVVMGAGFTVVKSGASAMFDLFTKGNADVVAYLSTMDEAGRAGAERLQAIWSDAVWDGAAAQVEANSGETSDKLAAPVVKAKEKISAAAKEAAATAKRLIGDSIAEWTATMQAGVQVTEAMRSPLEKYDAELVRLKGLLDNAAISEETFARATAKADAALDEANFAAISARMEEGARATEAARTPLEKYVADMERLRGLSTDKVIGSQTFDRSSLDAMEKFQGTNKDLFAGTQEQTELQAKRYEEMYAEIDAWRQADLASEQTAVQMKARLDQQIQAERLQGTQAFFGTLATMQNSSIREFAAIGKAAAIAQATIDGILAVQKALSSAPPPYNFAMAAAVGVATAANVAQISGIGFKGGGFTGWGSPDEPAGIVHGREFVSTEAATARYRPVLEAMNAGSAASGAGAVALGGVQVVVNNNAPGVRHEVRQISATEVEIIAREVVARDTPRVVENQLADPNSRTSRALVKTTSAGRRRS